MILCGEGPGRTEVKLGQPFKGLSGKLLDQLLVANRIPRREAHVTNARLCSGDYDRDNERGAECCAPRLLRELQALPSEVPIVTMGKPATRSLLGLKSSFLQTRGFIWHISPIPEAKLKASLRNAAAKKPDTPVRKEADLKSETLKARSLLASRVVLPTLHPAFVLRSETWHAVIRLDFARIGRILRGEVSTRPGDLADTKGSHTILKSKASLQRLYELHPTISLDIETTETPSPLLAKLLCVGLSDGRRTFVIWPWRRALAKPLGRFLHTRKEVVGHNLMTFDRVVLEAHGVR